MTDSDRALRHERLMIAVNSALAFASAALISVVIHEAAHGFVAQALGFSPKIYPFVEDNPRGTPLQDILIAAGGPIGSLLVGLVFAWLYASGGARFSYWRLLACWLAFQGLTEFINYLIVTPWLFAGDTAVIADRLGLGTIPRYVAAVVGVICLFAVRRRAAGMMYAAAPHSTALDTGGKRRRYIAITFYYPAFAGLALVALAAIGSKPEYAFYGLLATLGSTDIVGMAFGVTREPTEPRRTGDDAPIRIEPVAVALYVALVLAYVTVFIRGLPV